MDESAFYTESKAQKPALLNCPYCRQQESYALNWIVRTKRATLPPRADERDRAKFAKAQSYMVLLDNQANCTKCRRRFDISGIKTMAFL